MHVALGRNEKKKGCANFNPSDCNKNKNSALLTQA
jgi:hypothetical protein